VPKPRSVKARPPFQARRNDIESGYFRPTDVLSVEQEPQKPIGKLVAFRSKIRHWLRFPARIWSRPAKRTRGPLTHVIILDGTMSSLEPGEETNAGLAYRLLCETDSSARLSIHYEQGVQWTGWRNMLDVVEGRGIEQQIRRSYGFIASRYEPGDRIFLFGYSRGAYAVRSLAGLIDQVGLLKKHYATERHMRDAFRHYGSDSASRASQVFSKRYCHPTSPIEAICIWDCVKALGLRLPVLWRLTEKHHAFHNHHLGPSVKAGFHALALDEKREAYAPVLWESDPAWHGTLVQMWFRGSHGDVGGHLGGVEAARPLSNIPFVWMMDCAQSCGLDLPDGWQADFPQEPDAPSVGTLNGWGKIFLLRKSRVIGRDPSEHIHPSSQKAARHRRTLLRPWKAAR